MDVSKKPAKQHEGADEPKNNKKRKKTKSSISKDRKNSKLTEGAATDEEEVLINERNCSLCNRELPLFFYGNEEQIKRMPSRSMTKLLQDMKADLEKHVHYLKAMRVSPKFIQPCRCEKPVHTYCMTASII